MKGINLLVIGACLLSLKVESVSLNPQIGSNWAPPKAHRRTSQISRESSVVPETPQIYSTLPDPVVTPQASSFSVNSDPNQNQNQNQNFIIPDSNSNNYFNYQVVEPNQQVQAQPAQDSYLYQQPDTQFNFVPTGQQGFTGFGQNFHGFEQDGSNALEEQDSPGFLTRLMTSVLDNTGIGALWNSMNEMVSNITGGTDISGVFSSMRSVAMSAMALPMLLPMAGIPLVMGAVGLMAFPILQLTLPGIRRSFREGATLTQNVLKSEECVERLSCNLARVAKKIPYDGWISRFEKSENKWLSRVSKSVKAARTGEDCKQYACSPVTNIQNMVRTYLLGEKGESATKVEKS